MAEQDSAAAGPGQGSVLSEVTQPKVDLSYLQPFHPVRPAHAYVGASRGLQ